jgi:hypothetical protein
MSRFCRSDGSLDETLQTGRSATRMTSSGNADSPTLIESMGSLYPQPTYV